LYTVPFLPTRERFGVHPLRHRCASWLVQRGVSLPVVQSILGHADPSTTERYAHMAPDAMKQAMSVLDDSP
jgi:site-specific recombinase XerD